jgi:hypothetical protein
MLSFFAFSAVAGVSGYPEGDGFIAVQQQEKIVIDQIDQATTDIQYHKFELNSCDSCNSTISKLKSDNPGKDFIHTFIYATRKTGGSFIFYEPYNLKNLIISTARISQYKEAMFHRQGHRLNQESFLS